MVLTGDEGRLYLGYGMVATLGNWTVTRQQLTLGPPETTMEAMVVSCNDLWRVAPEFKLKLRLNDSWWVWRTFRRTSDMVKGTVLVGVIVGDPEIGKGE